MVAPGSAAGASRRVIMVEDTPDLCVPKSRMWGPQVRFCANWGRVTSPGYATLFLQLVETFTPHALTPSLPTEIGIICHH